MLKRRFKLLFSLILLVLMSIGLTVSTLHSHHNLELHNSAEFADTGHCLNADTTLCPICGYVLEGNEPHTLEATTLFLPSSMVENSDVHATPSRVYIPVLGRSPPAIA